MKAFFDTFFFFPFINVEVKGVSSKALLRAFQSEKIDILRSEMVLFEIAAKGTKYCDKKLINFEELTQGLNAIAYLPNVISIPFYFPETMEFAMHFQKEHTDFIDCLILASAIISADIFVTLDEALIQKAQKMWDKKIISYNNFFKVIHWDNFLQEYFS